jgi:hypothetical protein
MGESHDGGPVGIEILFLWRLATAGGGDWKKDVKPELETKVRRKLVKAGLLAESNRSPNPDGKGRKLLHFELTDAAWRWLAEHLDVPITSRSPASLEILVRLLGLVKANLDARGSSLAEFVSVATRPVRPPTLPAPSLESRIEAAYYALSGGQRNVRVRLADLKEQLRGADTSDIDRALGHLAASGRASLYALDDPREISPRDRYAALRTPTGEERHIIYLGGERS